MTQLQAGLDGELVPDGEMVVRSFKVARLTKEGKISEVLFSPSSTDRLDARNRLTVWAAKLTTDEQVCELTNTQITETVLSHMNVDNIRAIRAEPALPEVPSLEVEWHPLFTTESDGVKKPDERPGVDGHAGIRDLLIGGTVQRRHIRSELANKP